VYGKEKVIDSCSGKGKKGEKRKRGKKKTKKESRSPMIYFPLLAEERGFSPITRMDYIPRRGKKKRKKEKKKRREKECCSPRV